VHRVFDPSEAEVEAARRVVAALDDAKREGKGVASLDGKMIDAPVAERARRLIARAASASRAGRPQDD
jgi:citrate lyase subunit beta/citryl-CoA lyase